MIRSRYILGLLACLWMFNAQARVHHYGAAMDESDWVQEGSAVQCELRHSIPRYGEAVFTQSVDNELSFSVNVIRQPKHKGKEATLQSIPPEWKHESTARDLGTVDIAQSHQPFKVGRDMARRLLLELEEGMFPTLYYADWADGKDEVNVAISSVNFARARQDFLSCLAGLLPYGFKDIRQSRLYFNFKQSSLTQKAMQRLDKIASYILAAPDEIMVDIVGHTDAKGFRRFNEKLSRERANAVRDYLLKKGVKAMQMQVRGYGERKPAASNRTAKGRAQNRRVVVSLDK